MMAFFKTKRFQELVGAAVTLGITLVLGVQIGRNFPKKKKS
jgi:hypothetical protein